jgi:hypothetical protein
MARNRDFRVDVVRFQERACHCYSGAATLREAAAEATTEKRIASFMVAIRRRRKWKGTVTAIYLTFICSLISLLSEEFNNRKTKSVDTADVPPRKLNLSDTLTNDSRDLWDLFSISRALPGKAVRVTRSCIWVHSL